MIYSGQIITVISINFAIQLLKGKVFNQKHWEFRLYNEIVVSAWARL